MTLMPPVAEIVEATERAEDLLALWQEQKRLAHRIRIARLRFDMVGLDVEEQELLAGEVAEWKHLVKAYAASRRSA
jgi:hypothetical protein